MNIKFKKLEFWQIFFKVVLWISILPLLVIAFYNHSTSDDFSYGWMTRIAWVDTHSLWEVIKAVMLNVKETYFTWQGSYSAIALFTLQPGIWGENVYFLSTFIILGLFVFSYFYFFRKVCCKILKCNTKIGSISASVALFLSIQMAPSPAEAFFWWNGASYYVIFHSLALIFIINFIICVYEDQCSVKQWIGLSLLGIFIAGGNYITMLLAMELMGCAIVYSIYNRKTVTPKIIIIFLLSLVGFLVNCLSPGNAVRQSAYESWSPVKAILYSYHEAYLYIEEWTEPILVIALAFLFPFLWNAVTKNLETKIWEYLILFLIVVSLFASAFTPTLYAYGEAGPGRIQNIRYFLWILICILMELMVICLLKGIIEEYTTEYSVRKLTRAIYNRYALCFFWKHIILQYICWA